LAGFGDLRAFSLSLPSGPAWTAFNIPRSEGVLIFDTWLKGTFFREVSMKFPLSIIIPAVALISVLLWFALFYDQDSSEDSLAAKAVKWEEDQDSPQSESWPEPLPAEKNEAEAIVPEGAAEEPEEIVEEIEPEPEPILAAEKLSPQFLKRENYEKVLKKMLELSRTAVFQEKGGGIDPNHLVAESDSWSAEVINNPQEGMVMGNPFPNPLDPDLTFSVSDQQASYELRFCRGESGSVAITTLSYYSPKNSGPRFSIYWKDGKRYYSLIPDNGRKKPGRFSGLNEFSCPEHKKILEELGLTGKEKSPEDKEMLEETHINLRCKF